MSHFAHLLRRSVWFLSSLTILLPGLAAAQVPDDSQSIEERLPHIEQILTLRPLPEAEVLIQDFQATFLSNGKVKLSGSGQARVGGPVTAIEFEVDLIEATYRTRKVEPQEIADSLLETDDISFLEQELEDEPRGEKAVLPGNRAVTVKVKTRDNPRTSVSQSISMHGRNDAKLTYRWSHTDSGEGALLIFGWVVVG